MWNRQDFLPFFANGNAGGVNTVGAPATAKNVVSVGGTGNGENAGQICSSTSRGPTDDGRYKPTLCTPGQAVSSAIGGTDVAYWELSGTSMATPGAAGCGTLVRQYFAEGWYPTGQPVAEHALPQPSAALIKAMLANSGSPDVSGYSVPDNNIGWGRALLEDVTISV